MMRNNLEILLLERLHCIVKEEIDQNRIQAGSSSGSGSGSSGRLQVSDAITITISITIAGAVGAIAIGGTVAIYGAISERVAVRK